MSKKQPMPNPVPEEMVPLWPFTLPIEANYGQFYLTAQGTTVCFRIERKPDGEIKVVLWGEKPPPMYLEDIQFTATDVLPEANG